MSIQKQEHAYPKRQSAPFYKKYSYAASKLYHGIRAMSMDFYKKCTGFSSFFRMIARGWIFSLPLRKITQIP
ncbi:MAG: hypothetical protein ACI3XR_07080 [Eubacteriales bacterium]